MLAQTAMLSDTVEQAEEWFTSALEYDATKAIALAGLGKIFQEREAYEDAQEYFDRARELAPDSTSILIDYARYWTARRQVASDRESRMAYATTTVLLLNRARELGASSAETDALLANYLQTDAIMFTRMQAVGATGSAIMFSPTGGGQIHMEFSIVHAKTGVIEGFFGAVNSGGMFGKSIKSMLKNPDKHMQKIVKTATKKMPKLDQVLRPSKLDPARVQVAVIYDVADEDEIIDDLEDLLNDSE